MTEVKIKKLYPDSKLPTYAHPGDAGMDLYAQETMIFQSGEKKAVPTGVSMEIPVGYVGLIWDKSGIAVKEGVKSMGGVIDAGYRGEILIGMMNLSNRAYTFEKGHKVAQMLIQKIEHPRLTEVDKLSDSSRSEGRFGSTGK